MAVYCTGLYAERCGKIMTDGVNSTSVLQNIAF